MIEDAKIKPFLRWAGSKRMLLPILKPLWNAGFARYVEPFAGSACLFFSIAPQRALLGDLNHELMFTYRQIKNNSSNVIRAVHRLRKSKHEYLRLREQNPKLLKDAQRAARFIYLNRFCFNGLYRTNQAGQFNVPYGGQKTGQLPTVDVITSCSNLLKTTSLIVGDFENVLKKVTRGDFVYMDPPFRVKARRVFNEYDPAAFSDADVIRLRSWMHHFQRKKISFVVSYADSEEADELKRGFDSTVVRVKRNISGFLRSRGFAKEVLIVSRDLRGGLRNV